MQHKYVPQIDSLRALAVISVIVYHLHSAWLPGGFSGVDIFFVISGYVVSASLSNIENLNLGKFIVFFYAKRLLRILPALIICLLVVALATTLFIPKSWLGGSTTHTIILAFAGLSNFTLMNTGDSYFSPRTDFNPATHTWSLGIEEQFYLLLPLVYYFTLNRSRKSHFDSALQYLLPIIIAISLIYSASVSSTDTPKAYYSIFSRFWELGLGVVLFSLHNRDRRLPFFGSRPATSAVAGFFLLLVSFFLANKDHFPYPWAVASTLGAVLLIEAVTGQLAPNNQVLQILGKWPGPAIGKRSYSLYLWHWPVFVLFRWTCGIDSLPTQAVALLVTLLAAEFSFRYVESTTRSNARLVALPPLHLVGILIFVCAATAGICGITVTSQPKISLSVTSNAKEWTSEANDVMAMVTDDGCQLSRTENTMGSGFSIAYRQAGCSQDLKKSRLFILGDSHATALNRFAALYANKYKTEVYIYTKLGCSFLNLYETTKPECQDFFDTATTAILQNTRPDDQLLLASLRLRRLSDQWTRFNATDVINRSFDSSAVIARKNAVIEANAWIDRMSSSKLKIVFLAPPPIFGSPAFRCSDWFNRMNPICEGLLTSRRDFQLNYRSPVISAMKSLQTTHANVFVFDPFLEFCPTSECSAKMNGKSLFFDGDHLSGYGNDLLFSSFEMIK